MRFSRRSFVVRSGSLLAAMGAPFAVSPGKLLAAVTPSKPSSEGMSSVTGVSSAGVQVASRAGVIPIEGFPDGWAVEVGDHIALMPSLVSSTADVRAFPVVHWKSTRVTEPANLIPGALLPGDPSLRLESSAVISNFGWERDDTTARVCVVDRDPASGPDRIIAIRW